MSTAVTTTNDQPKGITALVRASAPRLTPLLPEGVTLEKLEQIMYFEAQKTPALLQCSPASIVQAVQRALRSGLDIGTTCYLIPYGKTCTFVADYKGLGQLMVAARAVRAVEMEAVREGDEFDFALGLDAHLRHVPKWSKDRKARPVIAAYVILRLPNGQSTFKAMSAEEIDAIRQEYSKQHKNGPLPGWYACKTVLKQIAKTMPTDERLARFYAAVAEDDDAETTVDIQDAEVVHDDRPAGVGPNGEDLQDDTWMND